MYNNTKNKNQNDAASISSRIKVEVIICGFCKMMVHEVYRLRLRANENRDQTTVQSLDALILGLQELAQAAATEDLTEAPWLNGVVFDSFIKLSKYPNDFSLHKKMGELYLEWHLPGAALGHFKRAWSLDPSDKALQTLIDLVTLHTKPRYEDGTADRPLPEGLRDQDGSEPFGEK